MGDEAAALDCEDEAVRRLVMPLREIFRTLQRVMRAVDLDRVEVAGSVGELVALAQPLRIKAAAPAAIAPAGDADADLAAPRCVFGRRDGTAGCRGATGCGGGAHGILRPSHARSPAC